MKLFNNLQHFQAVSLNNGYSLVHLPEHQTFLVDDVESSGGQHLVKCLTGIKCIVKEPGEIQKYQSGDKELSVKEYSKLKQKLSKFDEYTKDYDFEYDYNFPDLETEFEYRKTKQEIDKWIEVRTESKKVYKDVEIKLVGTFEDTGSKFIETPFISGNLNFGGTGIYKVLGSQVAADEFYKFVKSESLNFKNSTHSNIYYVEIDHNYVFAGNFHYDDIKPFIEKTDRFRLFNDLEKAKDFESYIRKIVRNHCNNFLNKSVDIPQKVLSKWNILQSIGGIQNRFLRIQPKMASYKEYETTLELIKGLIKDISEK